MGVNSASATADVRRTSACGRARPGALPGRTGWPHEARPRMLGLGLASPPLRWSQDELASRMASLWRLRGVSLARWRRIVDGSGIQQRRGVLTPMDVIGLTTAQRMEAYAQHAPQLAGEAAAAALADADVDPGEVTDLFIVTCTGFAAPGVDAALVRHLGLRPTVRRCTIGFMGCFGAITGLRAALGACAADRQGVALVVCVELCSLHMRDDPQPQNLVAAALFADGAAAAVVAGAECAGAGRSSRSLGPAGAAPIVEAGRSLLLPEGTAWMTWRITDTGFAMTLEREVPRAVRGSIGTFVGSPPERDRPRTFIIHPGGPGILDAVEDGLGPDAAPGVDAARHVLAGHGNMSSATVLFVLHEALHRRLPLPATLLAFGPGLTIESVDLTIDE